MHPAHRFQSQARSQSPGDAAETSTERKAGCVSISGEKPIPWRLGDRDIQPIILDVSISGEKPIPWRPRKSGKRHSRQRMFQSQARSQSPGDDHASRQSRDKSAVSISGEKPIPWRHRASDRAPAHQQVSISGEKPIPWRPTRDPGARAAAAEFQSQARSQSPGDCTMLLTSKSPR